MKLSKNQQKSIYMWCIEQGVSLQFGKLSFCDLRNFRYSNVYNNRRYQVHCEDYNCPWSKVYDELGPATEKFMELKNKSKKIK